MGVVSRIVLAMATAAAFGASADVLYKLIDKNGKVTYSEEKPKQFDGQVIRLDIDPNANRATLPKGGSQALTGKKPGEAQTEKSVGEIRLAQARERLERARAALQKARDNPADNEIEYLGNKGGGVRTLPTPEYQKKLEALEEEVKSAEEALLKAEQAS